MYKFNDRELKVFKQLEQAIQDIKDHPEHWDQERWHCGTSHCLAGFCDIRNGDTLDLTTYYEGVDEEFSSFAENYPYFGNSAEIFDWENDMKDIERIFNHIKLKGFEHDTNDLPAKNPVNIY